ncbi:MAG: hypothetical protein IJU45_05825 [Clostridia bacterium]|nr:hypothetical protein [Clostridia bacterium]
MRKKLISILISLCLITVIVQPLMLSAVSSVWGGGTAVPSLSGGYYQINSGENLAWFAAQVNGGNSSIKAKLINDILLNSGSTGRPWTPIGTQTNPFKGEFDGNGHYISGVYVNSTSDYAGLFGYVSADMPEVDDEDDTTEDIFSATPALMIHDVEVKNSTIIGASNTGGICGFIHYGIIKNCTFSGTVSSTGNSVGGICGYALNFSIIQQCITTNSVTGVIRVGGILGYANANVRILESYSTAMVTSNANLNGNSGGIVGAISSSILTGCYFMGNAAGPKRVGGIAGTNTYSTITGCYVLGIVRSTIQSSEYVFAVCGYSIGGVFVNCYYNQPNTIVEDSKAIARTIDDMKKFTFVRELNENCSYYTFDYMTLNNGYPVLAFTLETAVWSGGVDRPSTDNAGYYLINTADNLAWFAKLVNGTLAGVEQNTSAKAKVQENILLNIFITDDSDLTNAWTPIGSQAHPFTGTFLGNGYNIAGVYVNGTKNQGLFGYVEEAATISDVVLLDGLIQGTENVGGIAGYNKGRISLSCCDSVIKGEKAIGGIAGYNVGTIQTSYNNGTVECISQTGSQIGGVVGYNSRAMIKSCYNSGCVTGTEGANYYGGICGFNAGDGIYNCYNSGEVYGGFYVGGLIGYNSSGTVKYCYNRGVVNSKNAINNNTNNFTGYNYGSCSYTSCYYDNSIEDSIMNNSNGATGKPTAELTGSSIISSLSFPYGSWTAKADDNYFKYYPQIYELSISSNKKFKQDSLDSVRIVKDTYLLKVKVDGVSDTYYSDFPSAISAIGNKSGTIMPIRNITVSSTISVPNNITIKGDEFAKSIIKASGFTGALFDVSGSIVFGDVKNGSDENPLVTVNGNNVTSTTSMIILEEDASMTVYPGAVFGNAAATANGACISVNSGASLTINGGAFTDNATTLDGGCILNNGGTINITAGKINNNSATKRGAAIFNSSGEVNISGGEINNNYANQYGGAIYIAAGEVNLSGDVQINLNRALVGGAVFANDGTLTMSGGTMSQNFAYNKRGLVVTTGGGGAVAVSKNATFKMSGGLIDGNYVYNNNGDGFGITVFGTFEMSDAATVTNNDIYVAKNKTITVKNKLSAEGTAATITPSTYSEATVVLSGEGMGVSYTKFAVTPNSGVSWYVNSSGYLMSSPIVNVASMSKFGSYSVEYVSVAKAAEAIAAGESGIITVIADNTINETVKIYGDVTILSETNETFTSMRGGSFRGAMFEVQSGGTLHLGFTEIETQGSDVSPDDINFDSVGGEYIIDGGYAYSQATGTSVIDVKNGGTLYTYDDMTIQNANSTQNGTINVNGTMHMYGGQIRNNNARNGGAINIGMSGFVTLYGGTITGNTVQAGGFGGAIYSGGTLVRAANTYEYYQNEAVVATQKTYVNITEDNDVYLVYPKKLTLYNTTSTVLLSETTSDIPESSTMTPPRMMLTVQNISNGMTVLNGTDVGLHYNEFDLSTTGYYIKPDGSIGINLLVPKTTSSLNVNRDTLTVSGFNLTRTVSDFRDMFVNTDPIEFKDKSGSVLGDFDGVTTGTTIVLYNTNRTAVLDTITIVVYGDVDCNGVIDGRDSVYINCIAEGLLTAANSSVAQVLAADVDGSGQVTSSDTEYIQTCGLLMNTVDQFI